jgi:hypothetical protein
MKEEILDIAKKLYHNHLTPETATNLLLDLFAVSGQSEQLVCGRDIKSCVFYDKGKCKNNEYCRDQVEQTNCH